MKLNRFYFPAQYQLNKELALPIEICHKIINVLRHKVNDKIIIFNGSNVQATCKITSINKKNVSILVQDIEEKNLESPIKIHLGQAITKINKMEFIIQKACELGVYSITPLITERTVVKIHKNKELNKISHWQKIAISACEQSGRNFIPIINEPIKFEKWIADTTNSSNIDANFILHPNMEYYNTDNLNDKNNTNNTDNLNDTNNKKNINNTNFTKKTINESNTSSNHSSLSLTVGPEGGFSSSELSLAVKNKFLPFSLGPRILRAETAAIAGICALQIHFGDFYGIH